MRRATDSDVSNRGFPYLTAQHLAIGAVPVLALRISYAGELGWELYAPFESGQALWDELWRAGQPYGVVAAGLGAFESLRLEKGYRLWGNELHTEYNPLEAGLSFAVRMGKGDFIGRAALAKARAQGADAPTLLPDARRAQCGGHGRGADWGGRARRRLRHQCQLRLLH